jgi:glycosyltransferase involved in cell wall biosynthesis
MSDTRAYRTLLRAFRTNPPQIVHTHMAKAGALGRLAGYRAQVPVLVHTFHGHVLSGYFNRFANRAFLQAERRLASISDALTAVSSSVRDELLDLGIGTPAQWHIIPEGLELTPLLEPRIDSRTARHRLGLPAAGFLVGIVARLVPIKDHTTFLEAARSVATRHSDVNFVVVGDGELRTQLEREARASLRDRVYFTGWVLDLPTLYQALDIVVLTSRNEGTPIALIEAGAAARPVVATCVGGIPEVVQEGSTGFLVRAGQPVQMASRIVELLDNPELRARIGQNARTHVVSKFSAERLLGDVIQLYDLLTAGQSIPMT